MLILARKLTQSIIISDNIKVKVIRLNNYEVVLGIEAPNEISVHREEIYMKILEEKTKELAE